MTLILLDKGSGDLLSPALNAPDVHNSPTAHATDSISPRAVGTQLQAKIITKDSRIIANDGSNNIGLFGFDDAGNMVVKVAKAGHDANTATNDQLIFNSAQDTFKVVATDTHTVNYSFGSHSGSGFQNDWQTDTIAHGQSFTPAVEVYVQFPAFNSIPASQAPISNGSIAYFTFGGGTGFAFAVTMYTVNIDATNLYLGVNRWTNLGNGAFSSTVGADSGSVVFKYYLKQETAN